MKYSLVLAALLMSASVYADDVQPAQKTDTNCVNTVCAKKLVDPNDVIRDNVLVNEVSPTHQIRISVVGEGVAPLNTSSPAQAYALAKRAAIADAYRLIAEKVKGVRVEGQDSISNMMMQRSTVRTTVDAMIRNANLVDTRFKEGLCEVEMEIVLSYSQFAR